MKLVKLRDSDKARDYVLAGLAFARTQPLTATNLPIILHWLLEIISNGPTLPIGFVIDLGQIVLGRERTTRDLPIIPTWTTSRNYEDFVLGKLDADWTIERASDALRQYADADRPRGLSYIVRQLHRRLDCTAVSLTPAVVRNLLNEKPDELVAQAIALATTEPPALLIEQTNELIASFRRMAELLGPDDLAALEQRTAIAELGQYVAHRQIVQLVNRLDDRLPARPVRPRAGRRDVPTKVSDENVYPVGGYSSIGTKGTIESLLHSQLAFLEPGPGPDLFAIRYVRDELFYYTRDENQFLRRRRTFVILLDDSLAKSRFKDEQSPVQRVIFAVAAVVLLVQKLEAWLTTDALSIELIVPPKGLEHEVELLLILLRESIERTTVTLRPLAISAVTDHLDRVARTNETHVLTLGYDIRRIDRDGLVGTAIDVAEANPIRVDGHGDFQTWPDDDAESAWAEAILVTLADWV